MQLTKSEMEIMGALWDAGKPMCRGEILKAPHTYRDSSIHIMLNDMEGKGAIKVVGYVKSGKGNARTFAPTLSREKYWVQLIDSYGGIDKEELIREIGRA